MINLFMLKVKWGKIKLQLKHITYQVSSIKAVKIRTFTLTDSLGLRKNIHLRHV